MKNDGVLLLNKPRGMTSHDCVMKLRRLLGTKKVGHTGTLDPDVNGVLPICVGTATKLVQFLTAESKVYEGEVTIGYSTTTEDASGEIVDKLLVGSVDLITVEQIDAVMDSMVGTSLQVPPMYSAVKVNGRKLYEYARAGETVERPQREVTIFELYRTSDVIYVDGLVRFRFRVKGSKGIFIRTVAVTIGEKLGYPAHMSDLTRIASGNFLIENCSTLDDIAEGNYNLLSVKEALAEFSTVKVDKWVEKLVRNGVKLRQEQVSPQILDKPFLILGEKGEPLSISEWDEEKRMYVSLRGLW